MPRFHSFRKQQACPSLCGCAAQPWAWPPLKLKHLNRSGRSARARVELRQHRSHCAETTRKGSLSRRRCDMLLVQQAALQNDTRPSKTCGAYLQWKFLKFKFSLPDTQTVYFFSFSTSRRSSFYDLAATAARSNSDRIHKSRR